MIYIVVHINIAIRAYTSKQKAIEWASGYYKNDYQIIETKLYQ